jgi:hypothetical protein
MKLPAFGPIVDYVRRHGLWRTLMRTAYVAVNQLVRVSIYDTMTMRLEHINRSLLIQDDLESRFLTRDEMQRFAAKCDDRRGRMLIRASDCGDRCYGLIDKGNLVNFGFFSRHSTPLLGDLEVHFDEACWYMSGGWTAAEYRGRRLHGRGVLGGSQEVLEGGVSALVTVTEWTHYASTISTLRMGWQPSGKLVCLGSGPRRKFFATKRAKALGMRFGPYEEGGSA